uniref:Uncharacterized protein n=1 Tax=Hyaloperonospora arabidopsidis (strain Emoy2) TaxID=559515 RepID=M4BG79_HYAAE
MHLFGGELNRRIIRRDKDSKDERVWTEDVRSSLGTCIARYHFLTRATSRNSGDSSVAVAGRELSSGLLDRQSLCYVGSEIGDVALKHASFKGLGSRKFSDSYATGCFVTRH